MRSMDALVQHTEEGRRGHTICAGELPSSVDPVISEWGNPPSPLVVGESLCESISLEKATA